MKSLALLVLAVAFACSCSAQPTPARLIPIEASRWYQLNTTSDTSIRQLFDGKTDVRVQAGYRKILSNYENWYAVSETEAISIDSMRMYDGEGSFSETPLIISVVKENWQREQIASFKGLHYNQWVGPDPENPGSLALKAPTGKIRYIIISSANFNFPTEIQFFGSYTAPTANVANAASRVVPLKNMFGVNAFEWDFLSPQEPHKVSESLMQPVKAFRGVRHYLDWERLEPFEGVYSFNPTYHGSWNYDAMYERCKADGIDVLACVKTLPNWMLESYPDNMKDVENTPARYGKDLNDPASYIEFAKLGFQFAARYGANKNIDQSLINLYKTARWTGDFINEVKTGMNLVRYIECENERDKWWKGRKAYQTGREYAASLSAFYDGHMKTMGPGVGVKNADSTMQVVMAGLADPSVDYVKGMIDWCREFRGLKADGSINLCWDVINFHHYANDAEMAQHGESTRGAAPEVGSTAYIAKEFVKLSQRYAGGMPVWMTETGYDLNQGSRLKAIPIGEKTALQTQADWTLRTSLLYARTGIEKVFFFQLYDNNPEDPTIFNSMGLVNKDGSRRPAADFLLQTNRLLGNYVYKETLNANPIVDRYENQGSSMYMLVVPDEKGRTAVHQLNLGSYSNAYVYRPVIGADSMSVQLVSLTNGVLEILVTETPLFVKPGLVKTTEPVSDPTTPTKGGTKGKKPRVSVYPNPTTRQFVLDLETDISSNVQVNILSASGAVLSRQVLPRTSTRILRQFDLATLPFGVYFVEIIQGAERSVQRIVKTSN